MPSAAPDPGRPTDPPAAGADHAGGCVDLRDRPIDLRDRRAASRRGPSHLRPVPPVAEPTGRGATALQFSESVRRVVALARRSGLRPPVFRSPPRLAGVDRSIRRRPNGTVVVAVRRTGRPLAAVRADVIEGVVAANQLVGEPADRFRHAAWACLEDDGSTRRRTTAPPVGAPARVA